MKINPLSSLYIVFVLILMGVSSLASAVQSQDYEECPLLHQEGLRYRHHRVDTSDTLDKEVKNFIVGYEKFKNSEKLKEEELQNKPGKIWFPLISLNTIFYVVNSKLAPSHPEPGDDIDRFIESISKSRKLTYDKAEIIKDVQKYGDDEEKSIKYITFMYNVNDETAHNLYQAVKAKN